MNSFLFVRAFVSSWLFLGPVRLYKERRIYTLMHDPQLSLEHCWQNVAYNQLPHTGFYLGDGMNGFPRPNIQLVGVALRGHPSV